MAETNQKKTRQQNRQYWQAHDEACRKSGLTRTEYCKRYNLNVKTLAYWRHRLKSAEAAPVRLVQLTTKPQPSSAAVRLVVNGCGIEVSDGFNAATLAEVVCVLRRL